MAGAQRVRFRENKGNYRSIAYILLKIGVFR